jgi:tRNA (guanine37-N1)-methyltransferase
VRIDVITLFPDILDQPLRQSILGRAEKDGKVTFHLHQLREYTFDKHRTVDDRPYGGGPGMVLKTDVMFRAMEAVQAQAEPGHRILLSASGAKFTQAKARELALKPRLVFLTGHYEGTDERVAEHGVDEELAIGDYVLTNGAVAALVVIDAVVRLIPGVVGNEESTETESFSDGWLEGPQYTRPEEFQGWRVPEILLSGNHAQIREWRRAEGRKKTRRLRPDLVQDAQEEKTI